MTFGGTPRSWRNAAGLTEEFKDKFFEILHDGNVCPNGRPDYSGILLQLSKIKRKKGDTMMPFSFVSKLVAMHLEASPIYDRHVLAFFRKRATAASDAKAARIKWYVEFLEYVARSYVSWANDSRVAEILQRLKNRDQQLAAYGELGKDFAEAHHRVPLSQLRESVRTQIEDLITVCANCHRMLHRMAGKPSDIAKLRAIVKRQRGKRVSGSTMN